MCKYQAQDGYEINVVFWLKNLKVRNRFRDPFSCFRASANGCKRSNGCSFEIDTHIGKGK
jgi:hypothetical protein